MQTLRCFSKSLQLKTIDTKVYNRITSLNVKPQAFVRIQIIFIANCNNLFMGKISCKILIFSKFCNLRLFFPVFITETYSPVYKKIIFLFVHSLLVSWLHHQHILHFHVKAHTPKILQFSYIHSNKETILYEHVCIGTHSLLIYLTALTVEKKHGEWKWQQKIMNVFYEQIDKFFQTKVPFFRMFYYRETDRFLDYFLGVFSAEISDDERSCIPFMNFIVRKMCLFVLWLCHIRFHATFLSSIH